jgi:putative tryptophan/tyrosine transport system substrate-binding protein
MRRREFIVFIGTAVGFPLAARAQEKGRLYRLGSLHHSQRSAPNHVAFYEELKRQGFVEGQNLLVDEQGYGLRVEQLSEHAAELVKVPVDVIICAGDEAVRAAQQATKTIPILANATDMIGRGFVRSLANPDGNTTGFSILASELDGKRQEILLEAVPGLHRMAVLADDKVTSQQQLQVLQQAARAHQVELLIFRVSAPEHIGIAVEAAKNSGAEALNVLSSAFLYANRHLIIERTAALRIPAIYEWPTESEEGGLIGYGPSLIQLYQDVWARQLVRLFRGVKPTDLPIEQPTNFYLVVNFKTAKALGLTIPESFLARADKVIE